MCLLGNCTLWWTGSEMRCMNSGRKVKSLSRVRLFETPQTVACQAPPSMGFSRQEYWSVLPFPFPRDLSDPGVELGFTALQVDSLPAEPPEKPYITYSLPSLRICLFLIFHPIMFSTVRKIQCVTFHRVGTQQVIIYISSSVVLTTVLEPSLINNVNSKIFRDDPYIHFKYSQTFLPCGFLILYILC